MRKLLTPLGLAAAVATATLASAGELTDRISDGQSIRIGFATELPFAYPGSDNKPEGFANAYAIGVLNKMGYTNIEPVVTDWAGLIPALKAGRLDLITGGMYILGSRCQNVLFSEPMGTFGDVLIVPAGNPKDLNNYVQVRDKGATFSTVAGYNIVEAARKDGIPDDKMILVPELTGVLAAVTSGRADSGGLPYFTALIMAEEAAGAIDITAPRDMPEWTNNWVGIGFRPEDRDFRDQFNKAHAEYIGTDEMLAAVAPYGYTDAQLPGDATTDWICANR